MSAHRLCCTADSTCSAALATLALVYSRAVNVHIVLLAIVAGTVALWQRLAMSPQTRGFELRPDGTWAQHLAADPEHPARDLQSALLRRIVDRAE